MKIGFIGLGQMGKPMAINLAKKSGAEVSVHAVVTDAYADLKKAGACTVDDATDLCDSEIIFLCLPSSEVVHGVVLGDKGLMAGLRPGTIVVDTSTIAYVATLDVAKALAARGVEFMDAPVSGMESRAVDGTLTVMCGGEQTTYKKVEPYLQCFGNNLLYMGPTGSGQLTKLINQLLFDINCAALAEILPMAVKMGLDPDKVGSVVNSGTGRSYASESFIPRILKSDFSAGYPMKHAYKDLVSAAELGARMGVPMPVLAAATATYQTALLQGHGTRDKGGMILPFEALLGVEFRTRA